MTFLPIVDRELRVAARRRATYFVRCSAALMAIGVGTWIFLAMQQQAPGELAQVLFGVLAACAGLYGLLSGIRATSDCLSQEKREGTLGLLFLTDLKGYDVVLGKFVANSLGSFYGVVAVLPMLAIPLLLGGVTAGEFLRVSLVVVNTLFFSLAIGICVSSLTHSARKAGSATFLVLLVGTALLPAFGAWLSYLGKMPRLAQYSLLPSPGFNFFMAFDFAFRGRPNHFWTSAAVIHGLGWLALILASVIAPRSWRERPPGPRERKWRDRWHAWSYGNLEERAAFRSRLLDANAFFWLCARARLRPVYVWGVLALLSAGWFWGLAKYERDWLNEGTYVTTAIILNVLIKGWFASECGRQIAEDRQRGALELLLSTPLSVSDIVKGQWLALQRQFLGPTVLVLVFFVVFAMASVEAVANDHDRFMSLFWLGGMLMLAADLAAMFWVGVWQGLTARNPNRAASGTVARILFFPWVLYAVILMFYGLLTIGYRGSDPPWELTLGLWFVLGIATDLGFGLAARNNVLNRFREVAAQRYEPRTGLWRKLFAGA